jgi:flagellar hook assembly protein FlgD
MQVAYASKVTLLVYAVSGKKVNEVVSGTYTPGTHRIMWNGYSQEGNSVSNGTYYYQVTIGNDKMTGQFALIR